MSNPNPATEPGASPKRRHFAVTIVMVVTGIILLLPGLCALFFAYVFYPTFDSSLTVLWLFCFAVATAGIVLVVKAFR